MPQPQEQQQGSWTPVQDAKNAFGVLILVAQAFAHPVEVFLRTGFGSQYFGVPCLLGFFIITIWSGFFPTADPIPMWFVWGLYMLFLARARVESTWRLRKREVIHSRYHGDARLARLFKTTSESTIKGVIEPAAVTVLGLMLMETSEPVGTYLVVAGVALAFNQAVLVMAERARARELNDAWIEQQLLAERVRGMHSER